MNIDICYDLDFSQIDALLRCSIYMPASRSPYNEKRHKFLLNLAEKILGFKTIIKDSESPPQNPQHSSDISQDIYDSALRKFNTASGKRAKALADLDLLGIKEFEFTDDLKLYYRPLKIALTGQFSISLLKKLMTVLVNGAVLEKLSLISDQEIRQAVLFGTAGEQKPGNEQSWRESVQAILTGENPKPMLPQSATAKLSRNIYDLHGVFLTAWDELARTGLGDNAQFAENVIVAGLILCFEFITPRQGQEDRLLAFNEINLARYLAAATDYWRSKSSTPLPANGCDKDSDQRLVPSRYLVCMTKNPDFEDLTEVLYKNMYADMRSNIIARAKERAYNELLRRVDHLEQDLNTIQQEFRLATLSIDRNMKAIQSALQTIWDHHNFQETIEVTEERYETVYIRDQFRDEHVRQWIPPVKASVRIPLPKLETIGVSLLPHK